VDKLMKYRYLLAFGFALLAVGIFGSERQSSSQAVQETPSVDLCRYSLSQPEVAAQISDVKFSPDGALLVSSNNNRVICLWQTDHPNEPKAIEIEGNLANLGWFENGNLLAYAAGRTIGIIDVTTQQVRHEFQVADKMMDSIDLHSEGEYIAIGSTLGIDGMIELYDSATGELLSSEDLSEQSSPRRSFNTIFSEVDWHPRLPLVVGVNMRGVIVVLRLEDDKLVSYWPDSETNAPYLNQLRDLDLLAVDWHPVDQNVILTGGGHIINQMDNEQFDHSTYPTQGRLLLWELTEDRVEYPFFSFDGHESVVRTAEFSPDGRWIASADADTLRIWDYETRENVSTIPFTNATKLDWHPNGDQIAIGSRDGTLRIYDFADGQLTESVDLLSAPENK
jgi:WD40 repeat protein